MASSLDIVCNGGNINNLAKFGVGGGARRRPMSVAFGDRGRSAGRRGRITAAAVMTAAAAEKATATGLNVPMRLDLDLDLDLKSYGSKSDRREGKDSGVDASDRLDRWMRDSVVEIVKNLKEAPLLVQVFPKRNGDGVVSATATAPTTALVTEKRAMEKDWRAVKGNWESGKTALPEGLILVEELTGEEEEEKEEKRGKEKATKMWGVMVQGRRFGCGPVCYLLKTTRAGLGPMGPFCTHYCLMRVKNYRESVESQFKNAWLVQSQG